MKSPAALLGVFVAGAVASLAASSVVIGATLGVLPAIGSAYTAVLISLVFSLALLALSRTLLRHEGASLRELGLVPTRERRRQFGTGFAISGLLFFAIAVTQAAMVHAPWQLQGVPGIRAALIGVLVTGVLTLTEELLFRGVALRYLRSLYGDRAATLLSAVLFGAYHLVQSDDWAMGAVFRFLMPTLGGLLFGWAALRSRGLALPLGLHLGANWVQSSIAGFAPNVLAADAPVHALWRIPISIDDVRVLTAPDIGPHLPYVIAMAVAAAATWRLQPERQ
jgi:hypothetical protein